MDYNLNYRKTFTKPKQEVVVDATYSDANGLRNERYTERDYTLKYEPKNTYPFKQNTETEAKNTIISAQIDYVQPLKNQMKWELGGKTTLRKIGNDFTSNVYDYAAATFVMDTNLSNNFLYKENIYTAYTTFSGTIKNFGYQLGLRAEEANTRSEQITADETFTYNYLIYFLLSTYPKNCSRNRSFS